MLLVPTNFCLSDGYIMLWRKTFSLSKCNNFAMYNTLRGHDMHNNFLRLLFASTRVTHTLVICSALVIFFIKLWLCRVLTVAGTFLTDVDRFPWKSQSAFCVVRATHKVKSLGFACSPPFFYLTTTSRFSRLRWFSCAVAFRSLFYPWGKMGITRSLQLLYSHFPPVRNKVYFDLNNPINLNDTLCNVWKMLSIHDVHLVPQRK